MKYEEIRLIKQSEKSTVHLVRKKDDEQIFIQKILKGQHHIYMMLKDCQHPYLPKLYEINMADDYTTIIEEYIEGQSLSSSDLSEKQLVGAFKELCCVLEFLHGKDIIHRDIKPSNIIFAKDGHIRLIDFDAARMTKDDLEQDTKLLGTRGYAPPEQYGFAQTDARADIYALGITFKQLLGDNGQNHYYRHIIQKCTNLSPDKRYQSIRQVKRAFSYKIYSVFLCGFAAVLLLTFLCFGIKILYQPAQHEDIQPASKEETLPKSAELTVLPAPDSLYWDGETGVALWGNVPESGTEEEVRYNWRLYKTDTATSPNPEEDAWYCKGGMGGNGGRDKNFPTFEMNLSSYLEENGFYYFAVSAVGDGVTYSDSPYVISDAFEYKGEFAPPLPTPTDIEWKMVDSDQGPQCYATWSNLDDYADADRFNVSVYDEAGVCVTNNIWPKERIISIGHDGIWIDPEVFPKEGEAYRFTVQVYSSRPNEYKSSLMPDPAPEEYFSSWYNH